MAAVAEQFSMPREEIASVIEKLKSHHFRLKFVEEREAHVAEIKDSLAAEGHHHAYIRLN